MGLTYLNARLAARGPKGHRSVQFLADSGAIYSVLPEPIWKKMGLKPLREVEFTLADGTVITRQVSECFFEVQGQGGTSPVILGHKDDAPLLGAVTLEVLGLMLNPLSRELLPMRMMMAHVGK
ncbi:MAG: aspartyl protease family protein [Deltaproteobacteria bacterium]|nr:aspartyl protease family protein [Deltaproteobacteria bacterium]